ncbi:pitC [Scenedesmus sp. PABB004]|nr:pitC [Scenedesmus sp. PABB004]
MARGGITLLLLAALAALAQGQTIRNYTRAELFPGQICADDGTPNWEKLWVGDCPQGFNGIRNFAKARGLLPGTSATVTAPATTFTLQASWPYCNACKDAQRCFEFKPGVAKCIVPADAAKGKTFLAEGEVCLDFSNGNKKWKPEGVNPVLFGKTCEWPLTSCNWDEKANNGVYRCERIRATPTSEPVKKCYRAAGSRWWGGSDQWYAWNNGKFVPCGGPNPDYKSCENFPACAGAPRPWADPAAAAAPRAPPGRISMDVFEPLSEEQLNLALQLRELVARSGLPEKHPELQLFLNDWTYVRYLRARGWDLAKAQKMLMGTLQWRLATKPQEILWAAVEKEAETGKTFVSPHHDTEGRPVVVMRPRNQNTRNEEGQVQFLIYCLEHASRAADEQRVGKMTWLLDFEGYSLRNAPAVRTSLSVLHTLQNHYPERLGGAVCYHAPTLFSMTWKAVCPFIDPVTKRKITFVEKGPTEAAEMAARFDPATVEPCMGGAAPGPLFELPSYRARCEAEDAAVAAARAHAGPDLPLAVALAPHARAGRSGAAERQRGQRGPAASEWGAPEPEQHARESRAAPVAAGAERPLGMQARMPATRGAGAVRPMARGARPAAAAAAAPRLRRRPAAARGPAAYDQQADEALLQAPPTQQHEGQQQQQQQQQLPQRDRAQPSQQEHLQQQSREHERLQHQQRHHERYQQQQEHHQQQEQEHSREEQQREEQQHHHQQRAQQQQQQERAYARRGPVHPHPASLVSATWGMAERRAHLASLVRGADSVDGLAAVWLRCRGAAGPAELTVLFNRLAAVCEPRSMSAKGWNNAKALLRELLICSEDKMSAMGGPEYVYIIAALAKLRAAPDQAWLNRWLAVSRHKLSLLTPGQLVMCGRALCRLELAPREVKSCIAFPAWAHNYVAALRPRLPAASGFDLVKLAASLAALGYKPPRPFLNDLAAAVEPKLSVLDSIALASVMGSFSALRYEPEAAWMRAYYAQVYTKLPLFDDQDLATALCAFSSMRRLVRDDFLAEFLGEVAEKLPTFGTPALASVLGALAALGYAPPAAWCEKVAAALAPALWRANVHVAATAAWGLASCGHVPGPGFVEELLGATLPKLGAMEAGDAVHLGGALARWGYAPAPGSRAQRLWLKWWARFCGALDRKALHPKQVLAVLTAFQGARVSPEPATVDHLVSCLVAGGLQHAPVAGVAGLLDVLAAAQHTPGPLFVKNYAQCVSLVSTSLTAEQLGGALRCLAAARFAPASWWLVQMLAVAHARVPEFGGAPAAAMLWAAARLSQRSALPSAKWAADFADRLWAGLGGLGGAALGEGLWGAVAVGYAPSEEQWAAWEAAAARAGWALPLGPARDAVQAFRRAGRPVPAPLLDALSAQVEEARAERAAAVAAADDARREAAAALAAQQARAATTAAAAIAAHRAGAAAPGGGAGHAKGARQRKAARRRAAAAAGAAAGVLVLPTLGAGGGGAAQPTAAAAAAPGAPAG